MTTILIKKKDTAGAPAPGDLTNAAGGAELAVNTATKRLYSKDSGGNVIEIGTNPSTIDTTTVDTTNLEVTNIKAKDGTASATIADSTGIFTHSTATVFTAGSAAAPAITTSGDTNTGIFFPAADTIAFAEGGAEAARIDSSGNFLIGTGTNGTGRLQVTDAVNYTFEVKSGGSGISTIGGTSGTTQLAFQVNATEGMRLTSTGLGIGTSSPATKLHLATAANTGVLVSSTDGTTFKGIAFNTSDNQFTVGTQTNHPVAFFSNNTERARITAAGDVGIGTSSPGAKFELASGRAKFVGNSDQYNIEVKYNAATSGGWIGSPATDVLALYRGAGGTESMRIDSSGNVGIGTSSPSTYGKFVVAGGDGNTQFNVGTNGVLRVAGYISSYSGALLESVNTAQSAYLPIAINGSYAVVATGNTERMRLDSSGNLLVGTTSAALSDSTSFVFATAGAANGIVNHPNGSASGNPYFYFGYNGSSIGTITQSGTTAVLYNVTSDQRLKENIQDAAPASSLIDALQVRQFDWKSDASHQRYGFVAQELVTVAPEAVHQPADPDDMMAVDYSKLVPMLVKEIQSLRARVAALESN